MLRPFFIDNDQRPFLTPVGTVKTAVSKFLTSCISDLPSRSREDLYEKDQNRIHNSSGFHIVFNGN